MPRSLSCLAILKNERLRELIAFALREGWEVRLTPGGNIQLKRKGYASICNAAFLLETAADKLTQQIKQPHSCKGTKNG